MEIKLTPTAKHIFRIGMHLRYSPFFATVTEVLNSLALANVEAAVLPSLSEIQQQHLHKILMRSQIKFSTISNAFILMKTR